MASTTSTTRQPQLLMLLLLVMVPLFHALSIVSSGARRGDQSRASYRKCFCDPGGSFVCELHGSNAWPRRLARLAADRYNVERASPTRVYELRGVNTVQEILCSAQKANAMDCCERAFFGGLIPWKAQVDSSAPSLYHLTFELTEFPSKVVGKCRARLSFSSLPSKALRVELMACDFPQGGPDLAPSAPPHGLSLTDALQKLGANPPEVIGSVFPDSFGHVPGSLEPFWRLAKVGGSFVNLHRGDVGTSLILAQVRSAHQLVIPPPPRGDPETDPEADPEGDPEELRFQFDALMHEVPSQEMIPCSMLIGWREGHKVAVQFNCSEPAWVTATPATEEGSGSGHV